MDSHDESSQETYNPWSVVNLVFRHLADAGLHPVLGEAGDPGVPAAALLRALGITPSTDGNKKVTHRVNEELARLRQAFEAEHSGGASLRLRTNADTIRCVIQGTGPSNPGGTSQQGRDAS